MLTHSLRRVESFSSVCQYGQGTVWSIVLFTACIACSSHRCLDVSLFEKIQDYEEKTLSSSKKEARQLTLDHIDPMCFLSLVYTLACMY
jgi:hypothetical protein